MTLEDFYFLSQIISAVAIVASLIFVGLQLRQSDRTQRASMHQARTDRLISIDTVFLQPHMQDYLSGLAAPEDLTSQDLGKLRTLIHMMVVHYIDVDWQHRQGLLDKAAARQNLAAVAGFMSFPAVRAMWRGVLSHYFDPQLVERVERELIAGHPLRPALDLREIFRQALAKLRAE